MCRLLKNQEVILLQNTKNDNLVTETIDFVTKNVVKLLYQQGVTIACAESCTGGMLCEKITSVPGASEVFEMGIVSYSNRIKTKLLGVPEEILEEYGAVSEQTARLMAKGAVSRSGSQIGVAVTGIAGPGGGTEKKPVGTVFVCVIKNENGKEIVDVRDLALYKEEKNLTREKVRQLTVLKALEMVEKMCGQNEAEG